MKDKRVSIVIPCLNEVATIEEAVFRAKKTSIIRGLTLAEIIVADNGSTDGSINKVTKQKIARLVKVPVRGYGAALHWGIMGARAEYIFFADADLSYDFGELKKFTKFLNGRYDLVLGSRLKGKIEKGAMPFLNRYLGTPFLTFLIRAMYGIKTSDCNSGMRLVKKSFYKNLKMRNSGMEWASELLLKTALSKGAYAEVPITFYKDKRVTKPHLLRWADGWRHLKAIVLVKPNFLFFPLLFLVVCTLATIRSSFGLAFFSSLLSGALFLSIIAAKLLNFVIEKKNSRIISILNKVPLVSAAMGVTFLAFISVLAISDQHLGTKLFLISCSIIFDMWVFLIETIKTHLVNTLPSSKNG